MLLIKKQQLPLIILFSIFMLSGCTEEFLEGFSEPIPVQNQNTSPDSYEQDDTLSSAKAISVNETQLRNFNDDGDDWIKFNAIAGYQYTIQTSNLENGVDTVLALYDSSMNVIDWNDDIATDYSSRIFWTAQESGIYYIYSSYYGYSELYQPSFEYNMGYSISLTAQIAPEQPDLTITNVTLPASVAANQILTFSDSVINQGTADADGFNIDYYLTSIETYYLEPVYLGSRYVDSLAMNETDTVSSSFAIPGNLATGAYSLSAHVDNDNIITEINESNNISAAYTINIDLPLPADLTISDLTATDSVAAGESITITDIVSNSGYSASGIYVYYYISTDSSINATDTFIGSRPITNLDDSTPNINTGINISLPRDFPLGTYYLGAIVDAQNLVAENNDNDNTANVVAITVTSPQPSDLIFSDFTTDNYLNRYQNNISITDTVSNQGTANEMSFTVNYYRSSDDIIDPSLDTLLGQRTISSLAASASDTATSTFYINTYSLNSFYVGAIIDPTGTAIESDTTNNTSSTVTVSIVYPDLSMGAITLPPTALVGETISTTTTINNIGLAPFTQNVSIYYYLSTDNIIDTNDLYLSSSNYYDVLAVNESTNITANITIPLNLSNGTYYIAGIIDPYNYLGDTDTTNNTSIAVALEISGACVADSYEPDNEYTTATSIGVGQTQIHNFCEDTNTFDWLALSAIAGTSYSFETSVTNGTDSVIELFDTDGSTSLIYNDDGGQGYGSLISNWVAPSTGTYYLMMRSFSSYNTGFDDYSVTVSTP